MTKFCYTSLAAITCSFVGLPQSHGQDSKKTNDVTAIDILHNPDETMLEQARAANARLRADYPKGFALDADHAPHVTIIQRFVRTSDLDKVYAAVAKASKDENPTTWELKTTEYYDIPVEKLGVAGIVIEPTQDLIRFQQKLIAAIAPYTADKGGLPPFYVPGAVRVGSTGKCNHSEVTWAQALGSQCLALSMARNLLVRSLP